MLRLINGGVGCELECVNHASYVLGTETSH